MSYNLYTRLLGLFPKDRLLVGNILSVDTGQAVVKLHDGSMMTARGQGSIGDTVYIRGGIIEGTAPDLPLFEIEV